MSKQYAIKYEQHTDTQADPEEGEAYAIVRQNVENKKAPYLIAYVILKDEKDTLTIETDAAQPKNKIPIFDMYRISFLAKTFHERYESDYLVNKKSNSIEIEPKTIVLQKK